LPPLIGSLGLDVLRIRQRISNSRKVVSTLAMAWRSDSKRRSASGMSPAGSARLRFNAKMTWLLSIPRI